MKALAATALSVIFVFQQITGINLPLDYGPKLLGPFFSGAHATLVGTTLAGVEATLTITVFNVATTYFGFRWIDKSGRRRLSIGGYTGMIVFALVAALEIAFIGGIAKLAVVMLGLSGFISSFAIGVGGTGWTPQGELSRPPPLNDAHWEDGRLRGAVSIPHSVLPWTCA